MKEHNIIARARNEGSKHEQEEEEDKRPSRLNINSSKTIASSLNDLVEESKESVE